MYKAVIFNCMTSEASFYFKTLQAAKIALRNFAKKSGTKTDHLVAVSIEGYNKTGTERFKLSNTPPPKLGRRA